MKTSSRFSQRETDEACPILRPKRSASGPRTPAAEDRADEQPPAFPGDPPDGREPLLEDRIGGDRQRRTEIEKAGELERGDAPQDQLAEGGRGTEQERGENG